MNDELRSDGHDTRLKMGFYTDLTMLKRVAGEHCQYEDECDKDKDCGVRGRCIDVDATSFPRKQCFCEAGFHGDNCKLGELTT